MGKNTQKKNTGIVSADDQARKLAIKKQKEKKKQQKKERQQRLTANQIENLYVLREDDPELINERKLVNHYYMNIANKFYIASWLAILVLCGFLFWIFLSYKDEITIDNFRYLMRNVNFKLESAVSSDDVGSLIYDYDSDRKYAAFNEYLATAGGGRIIISDPDGNESYNDALDYNDPVLVAVDSYLLCYDRGGYEFTVYSYFNLIASGITDYPITDGDIANDGTVALVSKDKSYYGTVLIYNKNSQLTSKIMKSRHIVSVDLTDDGYVLVTGVYSDSDGSSITQVDLHQIGQTEPIYTCKVTGYIGYEAKFIENKKSILICDGAVIFIDDNGKVYNESTFDGENVLKYAIGSEYLALLYSDGQVMTIGDNTQVTTNIDAYPTEIVCSLDLIYCITYDGYYVYDPQNGTTEYTRCAGIQTVATNSHTQFICLNTAAVEITNEEKTQ